MDKKRILRAIIPTYDVYKTLRDGMADKEKFDRFAAQKNYLTPNTDTYFHTKAMYDATKGSFRRGAIAFLGGVIKEMKDYKDYSATKDKEYALREGLKDIKNNARGVYLSITHPFIPSDKNNAIKNLQTPTMRDIMPLYEALKNGKKN